MLITVGLILFILTVFYYLEAYALKRIKRSIPLKIAVTGSRGKSTTVRFLCKLFKESGYKVLGKVTGSEPFLILPDGRYEQIIRKSRPSILEQKKVLMQKAKELKPDVLITEIMSVTPEYQEIESKNIIAPDIYIITNVKEDHIGVTGDDKVEIANAFIKAAPDRSKVYIPEEEADYFKESGKDIETITQKSHFRRYIGENSQPGFFQTVRFAERIGKEKNIGSEKLVQAIRGFTFDTEVFFEKTIGGENIAVNAFSANDVESTKAIYEGLIARLDKTYELVGIFSTRSDKVNRTKQWIDSLKNDSWSFREMKVFGPHFSAIKRSRLPYNVTKLSEEDFESCFNNTQQKTAFFGFGNYVNSGEKVVNHWKELGG